MSRRRVADLLDLVDVDDNNYDQHIDVAFLPTEDTSSDEDSVHDPDEDILSCELPSGSYEHVRSSYTSTQKLLEHNHIYDWQNDAHNDISTDDDTCCSNHTPILSLRHKNALELFELFFSSSIKNYIIEATSENNFELNENDLEKFIVILVITIFNSMIIGQIAGSCSVPVNVKNTCAIVTKMDIREFQQT